MQKAIVLLVVTFLFGLVVGQRVSYAGYKVIRIQEADRLLFDTLYALHFDIWSHGGGQELDVNVNPQQLRTIDAMGLKYTVLIEDVGELIQREDREIAANKDNADFFLNYHQYNEVRDYFSGLATSNPDKVTFIPSIGKSIQGADLFGIRISTSKTDTKPIIWYNGGQHAREWVSISTVSWIATELLEQYGKMDNVTKIVDHFTFYIFPLVNPDGYAYTWASDRMWRKNRRENSARSFGVDLNRNWDNHWGGAGSSSDPNSDIYHGKSAFSEPETKAVSDFIKTLKGVKMGIDFHSYSQLILRPYGWTNKLPPTESVMKAIGDGMAGAIRATTKMNYISEHSIDLYITAGTALDWFYEPAGFYGYTIELRDTGAYGFVLPPAQIKPTGQENFAACVWSATYVMNQ